MLLETTKHSAMPVSVWYTQAAACVATFDQLQIEDRERAEYERLKAKYGGDG